MVSGNVASMFTLAAKNSPEPVLRRPHPLLGTWEYYAMVARTAIKAGNFVAIVVGEGPDAQLVPVAPAQVTLDVSSGLPWYIINEREYSWREVFHVRANCEPGQWWGLGIIEKFRVALSEQLHSQRYGEASFRTGGVPAGIATIHQTDPVTQDQSDAVNTSWQTKFGHGQRKVAVLNENISFTPVAWSPHDAEFAETRRISVAEAALMVGLRPEDLGSSYGGSGQTYGNRSDDAIQRIVDSYTPWVEILETPFSDLVGRPVEADPEALLRLTPREREEVEGIRLDNEIKRRQLGDTDTDDEETTE
jgi:phage portal protein BeeE